MKKKHILVLSSAISLILVLVASSFMTACAKPTITWNLQTHDITYEHRPNVQVLKMVERIKERTDGKFIINLALEEELGIERDAVSEALGEGMIESALMMTGMLERVMPHVGVYHLPQLTIGEGWAELGEELADMDTREMEKLGYSQVYPGAFYFLWTQELYTKDAIEDLTDLNGIKIRVWRSMTEDLLNELNAEPVYMAFPEIYLSVQRGVIDGWETGPPAAVGMSAWEIADHFYYVALPAGLDFFCVNTAAFNDLPDEYKTILQEEAKTTMAEIRAAHESDVAEALSALESNGMVMHTLNAAENDAWTAAGTKLWDVWASKNPLNKEALDIAKAFFGHK